MALTLFRKISLVISVLMIAGVSAYAQSRNPFFQVLEKDLGILPSSLVEAKTEFELVNNTTDTVSISSVKVSCGCTSVDYKKTPIAPGGKTLLHVAVRTKYKTGAFEEDMLVRLAPNNFPCILTVKGYKEHETRRTHQ